MARSELVLEERLRDLNCPKRADITVVIAAFGNAVDVRAEQNRLERIITPRTAADEIAGRIDRNIKFRRAHQSHHVLASLTIGIAVSQTAHAALRVFAEFSESVEVFNETRAIHAQLRL